MKGIEMTAAQVEAFNRKHHGAVIEKAATMPQEAIRPKDRMNVTEREFSLILEAQKRRGDILEWRFEGMTVRLADNCKFTPDFFVIVSRDPLKIRFVETKGRHIWDDSKVKFRVAKEQNSWAEWEMHQKLSGQWRQIL